MPSDMQPWWSMRQFFDAVVRSAREANLLSGEHFTVDGTLIDAWASLKRFKRKDRPPSKGDSSGEMVDFHGERRTNDTHQSTTDDEAKLYGKGKGKEARLCYGGHALMENRNGLCVDRQVRPALQNDTEATKKILARQANKRVCPSTLGADKSYHSKDFVAHLRKKKIAPHIAQIEGRNTPGRDARTTRHAGYASSQRKRKRIDEIFGWMKAYAGTRTGQSKEACLHRGRSLQPSQDEPVAVHHRIGTSAGRENEGFTSRSST